MVNFIKGTAFVTVRAIRCAWTLTYCTFIVVALVQLHAVFVDPAALPHMVDMTQDAFVNSVAYLKALV